MRSLVLQIKRGSRGFGLSLIYRGLDKYPEQETGIFVAKVVPGGQSERCGLKEDDKIISISNQTPRNVEDAVGIIKDAGKFVQVVIVRQEDAQDVNIAKVCSKLSVIKVTTYPRYSNPQVNQDQEQCPYKPM